MDPEQFQTFMQAFAQMMAHHEPPKPSTSIGNNEALIASLNSRILPFEYSPDNNLTFDTWYERHGVILEQDGASLKEPERVRLLVGKLQAVEFNRLTDAVSPQTPYERKYVQVVSDLRRLFGATKSLLMQRYECFNLKQNSGTSMAEFYAKVNGMCERAMSKPLTVESLKCLIFITGLGVEFQELRLRCLQLMEAKAAKPELQECTLAEIYDECQKQLSLKGDIHALAQQFQQKFTPTHATVYHVNSKRKFSSFKKFQPRNDSRIPSGNLCESCGRNHERSACPVSHLTCHKCGKRGHLSPMCGDSRVDRGRFQGQGKFKRHIRTDGVSILNCESVPVKDIQAQPWTVQLKLNGKSSSALLDTGARATMLTHKTWKQIGSPEIHPTECRGESFTKDNFTIFGYSRIRVQFKNEKERNLLAFIIPNNFFDIIGRNWINDLDFTDRISQVCKLGLSWRSNSNVKSISNFATEIVSSDSRKDKLINQFPDVFKQKLGRSKKKSHLHLKSGNHVDVEADMRNLLVAKTEILPVTAEELQEATKSDGDLQAVDKFMADGWPKKRPDGTLSSFFAHKDILSAFEGCLFQAERFVDTFKRSLSKINGNSTLSVLECLRTYCSTPSSTLQGRTPAEILLGRSIRTEIGRCSPKLDNQKNDSLNRALIKNSEKMAEQFNRHNGARPRNFKIGDFVFYRSRNVRGEAYWTEGVIVRLIGKVNYIVAGPTGAQHARSVNQLRTRVPLAPMPIARDVDPTEIEDVGDQPPQPRQRSPVHGHRQTTPEAATRPQPERRHEPRDRRPTNRLNVGRMNTKSYC